MAGQAILSANDVSPVTALGSTYTSFDLAGLLGPRSYVYVRNQDSSAWSAGLAVRQRSDLFATEGTALTADASTIATAITDASGPGAPWTTAGYVPDSINRVLYWHASATPTSTYYGKIYYNNADIDFFEEDPSAAAIGASGAYIIWRPYVFIKTAANDTLSVGGVTQSTISTLYHGWVQYAGFGYAYLIGDTTANGDGLGSIPGATAGYAKGVTAGTNDGYVYLYAMTDNSAASLYAPCMIAAPYMKNIG